jgi:hypothetical protein
MVLVEYADLWFLHGRKLRRRGGMDQGGMVRGDLFEGRTREDMRVMGYLFEGRIREDMRDLARGMPVAGQWSLGRER